MVESTERNLKQLIKVTGESEEATAMVFNEVWGPSPEYKEKPLDGFKLKWHPRAADEGGLILCDDGPKIPPAFNTMLKRIGAKIITGKFTDLFGITMPAETHAPYSYL
jgi:hypothetical protein